MLKPKKKLSIQREIREVVAKTTPWKRLQAFWEENAKWLNYGGLALVIVIVGAIVWVSRQKADAREAALELSRIQSYYDAGEYQTAIAGDSVKLIRGQQVQGLKSIADAYGGTTPGKIAALYLANCYYYTGQYADAKVYFIKAESLGDPLFAAAGYAGEAAVLESDKQYGEAAKYFQRASQQSAVNPNDPVYMVSAARCFANSAQTNKAIELYKRVVYEFAGTNSEETARHALADLQVGL